MRTAYKCRAYPYLTAMKVTEELAWLNEVSSVPGTSRVQSAVKQEPRLARTGIPVPQGGK